MSVHNFDLFLQKNGYSWKEVSYARARLLRGLKLAKRQQMLLAEFYLSDVWVARYLLTKDTGGTRELRLAYAQDIIDTREFGQMISKLPARQPTGAFSVIELE